MFRLTGAVSAYPIVRRWLVGEANQTQLGTDFTPCFGSDTTWHKSESRHNLAQLFLLLVAHKYTLTLAIMDYAAYGYVQAMAQKGNHE